MNLYTPDLIWKKKKSSNPHIKDWERLEIQKIYFSLSTVRR